jgi:uncharacterized protein (TIGR03000 family)
MIHWLFAPRCALAFMAVTIALPHAGLAQEKSAASDPELIRRHDWETAATRAPVPDPARCGNWEFGLMTAPGYYHSGWPYGPSVAPDWGYPGLIGGPYVGYPWGWPGYSGRAGQNWSNGLSLHGPPVPVYGPVPGYLGASDQNHVWRDAPRLGIGYGWVGIYAASPRPRPLTVNVWPVIESVPTPVAPEAAVVPPAGAALILSVKVPQPSAEVFVDGVKTAQTGTDRTYESPPLEVGKQYKYELTVRWLEGGKVREVKKAVVGAPGEVVRVDFTMP